MADANDQSLALFKSLCAKRQIMHKNKFATLSGMFFSHFEPITLHNAKFLAPANLFAEVADPTNTRRKFIMALRKLLTYFLLNPLHRDFKKMLSQAEKLGTGEIQAFSEENLISLVSRDMPDFLSPAPSCGRPLPHPKRSGLKSLP